MNVVRPLPDTVRGEFAEDTALPLYRQLYDRIVQSILDGRLQPGDRLPSARAYASEAGVARGTVDAAYGMLAGNGFIETRPRIGTIVAHRPPAGSGDAPASQNHAASARPARSWRPDTLLPLSPGIPALDLFPRTIWAQAIGRAARATGSTDMIYPDAAGLAQLRNAIATHLGVSRGIVCAPEQVVVTGGFQSGLSLVMRELAAPGQSVWLEDPGYPVARAAVHRAALEPIMVAVDQEGLSVDAGRSLDPRAALCIVTPAHQYPLGISMSLARRQALLAWANERGAWVIEDDFDGEFRSDGRSLPSLKSIDDGERVLYSGTFSKSLFPGLRLGYIVAPTPIADRLRRALRLSGGGRSIVDQAAVADLLASGQFARHVQRMRLAYAARREAMTRAIETEFAGGAQVDQALGGLHLLLRIAGEGSRFAHFEPLTPDGLGALALARLTTREDLRDALIVGFANVPERRAPTLARRLAEAIARGRPPSNPAS